mmetsp:Transcript_17424/g.36501  ORF Transcript_17424/g.36501 Transcript_17424/m.36501 type:complete len:436 (-) Transcript_17424:57-1364(-)
MPDREDRRRREKSPETTNEDTTPEKTSSGPQFLCGNNSITADSEIEIEKCCKSKAYSKISATIEPFRENNIQEMTTTMPPKCRTFATEQSLTQIHEQIKQELLHHQDQVNSLIHNHQKQIDALHKDNRHLLKRCKFLEKQCEIYKNRQKKMEAIFFKKRAKKAVEEGDRGESSKTHDNEDDDSIDEEAAEAFFAGEDEDALFDGSDDGESKDGPKVIPDRKIYTAKVLDFKLMFEKLKNFRQQHGHCFVPKEYDVQLRQWCFNWKERRATFEKMVMDDGGPEVVFPSLGDIDDKINEDEILGYDYGWENEKVQHIESIEAQNRRRYLLRTRHRIMCLNTLDFVWTIKRMPKFEDRLEQLQSFIKENGHYNVPREHGALGEWFHKMKNNFALGKKHFMEKRYPIMLEMGVDMNIAVQGRRKRRRKFSHGVEENHGV